MKLGQSYNSRKNTRHECSSFNTYDKVRYCNACHKAQYNYTGEWIPEISLHHFVDKWTGGMGGGTGYDKYLRIDVSLPFEARSYESWDIMYSVTFLDGEYKDQTFEWFANLNEADFKMQSKGLKHFWERVKERREKNEN